MKKPAKKMPPTALTNDDWDVLENLARDSKRGKICRRCGDEIDGKAPGRERFCDACSPTRGKKLLLALNEREHVLVKTAAAEAGQPVAVFIRNAALKQSKEG